MSAFFLKEAEAFHRHIYSPFMWISLCNDKMYSWKVSSHCTANVNKYFARAKSHRNLANYRFSCGIEVCSGNFRTFSALKSHMHRNHILAVPLKQNRCQHSDELKCTIQGCDYVADNFSLLSVHLRIHIRNGKKVNCPFEGCSKYFRVRTSFVTHLSRKHRQSFVAQPPQDPWIQVENIQVQDDNEMIDPSPDDSHKSQRKRILH